MIYQDARVDIQSGDLLAWSGRSTIGRFIRSWTGSTASHVGVAWVVAGRVLVLEAREGRGVTVRPLSRALPAIWVQRDAPWPEALETLALERLGEPYSYWGALRAGLGLRLCSRGWQCAEYAASILDISLRSPTPAALVEAVLTQSPNAASRRLTL